MEQTSVEGLKQWHSQTDDIFEALNTAWNETYWSPYWDSHLDPSSQTGWKQGYAYTLADKDFLAAHPNPPTALELYEYLSVNYPGRFTLAQVQKYVNGDISPTWDVDMRMEAKGEEYMLRQDIWDALAWVGPGKNRGLINDALSVIDKDILDNWYNHDGQLYSGDTAKLTQFRDALQQAIVRLGIPAPTRDQLVEFMQAEDLNRQVKDFTREKYGVTEEAFNAAVNAYNDNSRNLRKKDPAAYRMMIDYYKTIRPIFAAQNPLWGKYYLWKPSAPEELGSLPAGVPQPPSIVGSGTGAPGAVQAISGWPSGLEQTVGPDLTYTIKQALSHDYWHISYPAKQALLAFAKTHPEWNAFIVQILAKSP